MPPWENFLIPFVLSSKVMISNLDEVSLQIHFRTQNYCITKKVFFDERMLECEEISIVIFIFFAKKNCNISVGVFGGRLPVPIFIGKGCEPPTLPIKIGMLWSSWTNLISLSILEFLFYFSKILFSILFELLLLLWDNYPFKLISNHLHYV